MRPAARAPTCSRLSHSIAILRLVDESVEQLRARHKRLDAQYRAHGERLKALLAKRGAEARRQAIELYAKLRELQEELDRVQKQIRDLERDRK